MRKVSRNLLLKLFGAYRTFNDPDYLPGHCHAGRDGDCIWVACPQLRDNEPERSGRHCPFDNREDCE